MRRLYWFVGCPFCQQGRLFILRNVSANKLYFHCEECERGYDNPSALTVANSFLTLTEKFEGELPSLAQIQAYGWAAYALHEVIG
jgi:hypothetical protein